MNINLEKFRSPQGIFIIYILVSGILIMIFRFIFPGSEAPILLYSRNWRLVKGLLELFSWYPALALSAFVIPFGFVTYEENFQSFSDVFFKRLLVSVITAICASVIYGIIFFFALPMVKNIEEDMRYSGELYQLSKLHARERAGDGEWTEAAQFLAICDNIWSNSPELADLRIEININVDKMQSIENHERYLARTTLARDWRYSNTRTADLSALSGNRQPLNATQAISMGSAAFNEKRYFDAHWLFTLGERLAVEGSAEAANAARYASDAWNMIASQSPNLREQRLYQIYSFKLSGYQAMNTGDWIRAFYIFQELLTLTPDDPDAINFLAASERGAGETAFFIDEMELSLGEILTGAVFSLPNDNGRAVIRFSSLTTSDDIAYGMGFEYMSFDENSRPVTSVRSRYAKLLPVNVNEKPHVLVLTHALDRDNEKNYYDGEWLAGNKAAGGILLNVSFEELLLLSYIRRGLQKLQVTDLFLAAEKSNNFGYVYQIFQAEILNRIGSALFFLPVAILVIVIAWRYRVKERPRYLFILMLPVLPVVFLGFVFLYTSLINTLGIWLVLSMGFGFALTIYIVIMALFLFISLIVLAAQHA
jgi:hypothetical protein